MRAALVKDLAKALKHVDRPGTFCVSGAMPAVLPGLVVDKVGPIALPLTAVQAKELRGQCEQAPYGKGRKTLVDTSVRRVWGLKPKHFKLNQSGLAAVSRPHRRRSAEGIGTGKTEAPESSVRPFAV